MTNYDELVKRLPATARTMNGADGGAGDGNTYVPGPYGRGNQELDKEAADAITRLQADLKEAVEALSEIRSQANGHKRSIAYNQGVNIALENIENISAGIVAKHGGEKG